MNILFSGFWQTVKFFISPNSVDTILFFSSSILYILIYFKSTSVNILLILLILDIMVKEDISRTFKDLQPENNPSILVTNVVWKFDKLTEINSVHP